MAATEKQKKNLTPFPKGKSGNPNGRPKMPNLRDAIAKCLSEEKDGVSAIEAIVNALRAKASKGDVRAAQELLDRGFGKPKQNVELGGGLSIGLDAKEDYE